MRKPRTNKQNELDRIADELGPLIHALETGAVDLDADGAQFTDEDLLLKTIEGLLEL